MRTGTRRRKRVIRRNKSAPQPLGRRRTGPRLILTALVAVAAFALLPGPAMAASPTIESESVSHITGSDATLEAHLNTVAVEAPGADYQFEVATSPSQLAPEFTCPTAGFPHGSSLCSGVPEKQGSLPISLAERGKTGLLVTADANEDTDHLKLAPNTTYYYRVVAAQAVQTADTTQWVKPAVDGPTQSFTTAPPQHWYSNAAKATEGEEIPIVIWGNEVNLSVTGNPEVNCKNVGGGTVDNPVGGGAGEGRTNSLAFYECKGEMCEKLILEKFGVPGRVTFTFENNPGASKEPAFPGWTNLLEESTVGGVSSIREKIGEPFVTFKTPSPPGMLRGTEECTIAPTGQVVGEFIYEGELKPEIGVAKTGNLNGSSTATPSQFKFNGETTGRLHSQQTPESTWSDNEKYLGYFRQEVITVKP